MTTKNVCAKLSRNKKVEFDDIGKLIDAINAECAIAPLGDEMRFVFFDKDGAPIFRRKRDAETALAPFTLTAKKKGGKPKPDESNAKKPGKKKKSEAGFTIWLKSQERKEYTRVVFNPNIDAVPPDELNLFGGFAVAPALGDWSLLRTHMLENICGGDETLFNYLLAWCAQIFQQPEKKSGVIVVLRGEEGVGKSKLGEWIAELVGERHSLVIDKGDLLTGRFTSHLETKLFCLVEEAVFAGDPRKAEVLRAMATGATTTYEAKGREAYTGQSFIRAMQTGNPEWLVPVGAKDRRYFVIDVWDAHKEDKPYFAAIDNQMKAGGAEAMLYELLRADITPVTHGKVPMTRAKAEQIRNGFSPAMQWLESILIEGRLPFKDEGERIGVEWKEWGAEILKDDVVASYREFVPGYRAPATSQQVMQFLKKQIPGITESKPTENGERVRYLKFPKLSDVRRAFIEKHPSYAFEDDGATEADYVVGASPRNVTPIRMVA